MSFTERDFTEEVVFSPFPQLAELLVTGEGHAFGFIEDPGRLRFVWDGVAGEPFDQLVPMRDGSTMFWSADGLHIAYIGFRGDRAFVGRDGGEDPSFDVPTGSVPPTFSADGAHLAYGAQVDGSFRLVLDGERLASDAELAPIGVAFSPDGSRLAYVEIVTAPDGKPQQRIVLDGLAGPAFAGMRNAPGVLQFSPNGLRFAHYRINSKMEGQWAVDGIEQQWINDVRPLGFAQLRGVGVMDPPMIAGFSPDSRRFAYWADVKDKGVAVVEDDIRGPLFRGIGSPMFSTDSRHLAYVCQTQDKSVLLVRDGAAGSPWPGVALALPAFSPDSEHVAFTFFREAGGFLSKRRTVGLVLDDQLVFESPGDAVIDQPVFNLDGAHVAWSLRNGSEVFVAVDDRPGSPMDACGPPVFTASGRVAHVAQFKEFQTIVIDGRPGPMSLAVAVLTNDPTDPHFRVAPDGEHVAWIGLFSDGWHPVIDDRVGPAYLQMATCWFLDDGSAEWWGRREDAVYRVTASP